MAKITKRALTVDGYVEVYAPGHPRAIRSYIKEHILVMEEALCRYILPTEVIHHIDNDKTNNHPSNLMLFTSNGEHIMYHTKLRAFDACGNYNWIKCHHCKNYDDPKNLHTYKNKKGVTVGYHNKCAAEYQRKQKISLYNMRKLILQSEQGEYDNV